ncbi:hypothetical protein L7F22_005265 [Adiantum nelumboides]|nr:hypothetical protein [Adiantum nelumboides]
MLDQVAGHEMYGFLDGYSGYNQINLAKEDREKTTFIIEWGAFIYLVMPFGLCNAPTTFQRAMMTVFAIYLQKFMAIFVDDFTVYSSTAKHLDYPRLMFQKYREKRVCLNPYKCLFGAFKGVLLGYVVSRDGIEMTQDKIKAIQEAVAPTNANETSSFLGYVNFYRRSMSLSAVVLEQSSEGSCGLLSSCGLEQSLVSGAMACSSCEADGKACCGSCKALNERSYEKVAGASRCSCYGLLRTLSEENCRRRGSSVMGCCCHGG